MGTFSSGVDWTGAEMLAETAGVEVREGAAGTAGVGAAREMTG